MPILGTIESLTEVIKSQSEIIYSLALEIEHSKQTGCYITDTVSDKIISTAKTLQKISNEL